MYSGLVGQSVSIESQASTGRSWEDAKSTVGWVDLMPPSSVTRTNSWPLWQLYIPLYTWIGSLSVIRELLKRLEVELVRALERRGCLWASLPWGFSLVLPFPDLNPSLIVMFSGPSPAPHHVHLLGDFPALFVTRCPPHNH